LPSSCASCAAPATPPFAAPLLARPCGARYHVLHMSTTGATELVHIGQAVLGLGGGIDYFLQTVFNYPTLAECYKVAALDGYNKLRSLVGPAAATAPAPT